MKRDVLITGASSGLGRYLHERMPSRALKRGGLPPEVGSAGGSQEPVIIHCAFNSSFMIASGGLESYLNENLMWTLNLLKTPHSKFVYISSVDVYPKDAICYDENLDYFIEGGTLYSMTKIFAETFVKKMSTNFLILRCASMLGPYIKPNSIHKIIVDDNMQLSIASNSEFNCVLHFDIKNFIDSAIERDMCGIYNVASNDNVKISDIADMFNKKVSYGSYTYNVGNISNEKIKTQNRAFDKSSIASILQYSDELSAQRWS
ncbi:MAG: NAD-dependent epimerase/dehydratase family protein [Syntrophobacteraceae bacterium]